MAAKTRGSAATTRQRKVTCPDCGYTVRMARSWMQVGLPTCPCGEGMRPSRRRTWRSADSSDRTTCRRRCGPPFVARTDGKTASFARAPRTRLIWRPGAVTWTHVASAPHTALTPGAIAGYRTAPIAAPPATLSMSTWPPSWRCHSEPDHPDRSSAERGRRNTGPARATKSERR
jgi:hypothetical protein